ncbi:bifunctional precorrin-2 dehydrogenase/sirohydrochlorin ferrochelatase MET8 [Kluyveromyces lactis]|uniref:precorrin-2 dehydrogenase n=1 Tax=Kluyveromyces lactis (strain ATCC 8585 / CBS 2359 / DSM 70799 / NBRC 1267 / NRRL Y-1140 / WM37) TaxID=284590 RepID=Q6CUE3_KLULA|nr:uncharacterized protein KLLA0_C05544g [Kluyveromyces lactis]CAH01297.1 KLLA0C05544p [Kluyveromyces lactis]|eukprot:XP_452446.1 uncharacterized protein KLLA0_C05544g [Kluyveromyces lactis]
MLQLSHKLDGRHILLVGCGEVGYTRVLKLLPTGCKLTIISPEIHPKLTDLVNNDQYQPGQIYKYLARNFEEDDLVMYGNNQVSKVEDLNKPLGFHMVFTCLPDLKLSTRIYQLTKLKLGMGTLCNVADQPPLCDFYFGANLRLGDENFGLSIMISSEGMSPRFTALFKKELLSRYGDYPIKECVGKLSEVRERVRTTSEKYLDQFDNDNAQLIKFRMEWLKALTDKMGIECYKLDTDKVIKLFEDMIKTKRFELKDVPENSIM